jgi:hypothetical protein
MSHLFVVLLEFVLWQQFGIAGSFYIISMVVVLSFLWLEVDNHCCKHGWQYRPDFESYRKLQNLEKIINSFIRTRLLPIFAWIYPIIQIILLYVVIKLWHSESEIVKALIFTWMYFGIIIFTTGIFSARAKILNLSKEWIKGGRTDRHGGLISSIDFRWRANKPLNGS